jgi:hypothetical protein
VKLGGFIVLPRGFGLLPFEKELFESLRKICGAGMRAHNKGFSPGTGKGSSGGISVRGWV